MRPMTRISQQGSALLTSLAILTAITIGATVAVQQSTLQVRMVNNMAVERQVFTGAQSFTDRTFDNLRGMSLNVFADLRNRENRKITEQAGLGIDEANMSFGTEKLYPFTQFNWNAPAHDDLKALGNVNVEITYASDVSRDALDTTGVPVLRNSPNTCATCVGRYPFRVQTTSTDRSGNIQSTVQLGVVVQAASAL